MNTIKSAIAFLLFAVLVSCHQKPTTFETRQGMSLPPELVAIDSLMQTRPDSALVCLLETPVDDPYYQLLFSEALYKNDNPQLNRKELLDALAFYDSICCSDGEHTAATVAFLSARCHYMNGVGYYEMDSVVPACEEYLKALEIMEDHFDEKDLVGYNAKFMALTYSHLCELFAGQFLHMQVIVFAKKAYEYFQKYGSLPWQSAWALNIIGTNYHMIKQLDSADYYSQKAANILEDTNCLIYRDIQAHEALIEYELGSVEKPLLQLKSLVSKAETNKEYFARCLALGEMLYLENELDSAEMYLEEIFIGNSDVTSKKQAAELLVSIHETKGEFEKALPFADYLVPFANLNENQGFIKSKLVNTYQDYEQRKTEYLHQQQVGKNHRRVAVIMEVFVVLIVLVAALYVLRTKQLKNERREQKIKRAALAGRLKQSNEALKNERENRTKAAISNINDDDIYVRYEEEPICRHILSVCSDEKNHIKSGITVSAYTGIALTHIQKAQLKDAANRHYGPLFEELKYRYPQLKESDYLFCYLCLLGLDNSQIAVMMKRSYSTIWEREKRLKQFFNTKDGISVALHGFFIDWKSNC